MTVVDRGPVVGGTTGAGEGNLLVSGKAPGPELELALSSPRLWAQVAQEPVRPVEYGAESGFARVETPDVLDGLRTFADIRRTAGATAAPVPADRLHDLEPRLAPGLAGGVHDPQDAQTMPALAHLLRASGARPLTGREATRVPRTADGAVRGVRTDRGDLRAPAVVDAAGTRGEDVPLRPGEGGDVRHRAAPVVLGVVSPPS